MKHYYYYYGISSINNLKQRNMKIEINTTEMINRVISGRNEAQRNLDRELKYSEDLRDYKSINFSKNHIAKMNEALVNKFITI